MKYIMYFLVGMAIIGAFVMLIIFSEYSGIR